jgi:hypothetical protein
MLERLDRNAYRTGMNGPKSMAALGWAAFVAAALLAASQAESQRFVRTADPQHPRVRYADSLDSVNDRCIVAKNRLNLKVRPVYVNGRPIGFC